MVDWNHFEYVSFDCYGTLIDWETGILGYLRPLLRSKGVQASDGDILNLYSDFEPRQQSGAYRRYREVLAAVVHDFAAEFKFKVDDAEANGLAESIRNWQAFPDTVQGLQRLKSKYKLAILSNIDDDLFALTAKHLQVPFDVIVTAQQAGSYKPSRANFELLLKKVAVPRDKLLHAAESLYHDVVPAHELGITTVWVNRRQGKPAAATRRAQANPDAEVASLGELADLATTR
jgi:2-haloacid dehalogenase